MALVVALGVNDGFKLDEVRFHERKRSGNF